VALLFHRPPGGGASGVLGPGLDLKADGGYVIAPPSVHPSGEHYRWADDLSKTRPAPCPPWLVAGRAEEKPVVQVDARVADAADSRLGRGFAALGLLGRSLDGGKRSVVCPWQSKHTTGVAHDSSTVIFPRTVLMGLGAFIARTHTARDARSRRRCAN
jgi:hypothetical protein